MQATQITITKYVAEEGKYFCNEEQKVIATQLFLGVNDSIENWPEITEEKKNELEAKWQEEAEKELEETPTEE